MAEAPTAAEEVVQTEVVEAARTIGGPEIIGLEDPDTHQTLLKAVVTAIMSMVRTRGTVWRH